MAGKRNEEMLEEQQEEIQSFLVECLQKKKYQTSQMKLKRLLLSPSVEQFLRQNKSALFRKPLQIIKFLR